MEPHIELPKHFLIYAFRYALGRKTYAVSDVCDEIKKYWNVLAPHKKSLIRKEIKEHERLYGDLGHDCDRKNWYEILELSDCE